MSCTRPVDSLVLTNARVGAMGHESLCDSLDGNCELLQVAEGAEGIDQLGIEFARLPRYGAA
jgi:hypothetical protein